MTLTATQGLRARRSGARPAQGLACGPNDVGRNPWIPPRAQALATQGQVRSVQAMPPGEIRALATSQIEKARALYAKVSGSWWNRSGLEIMRWSPFEKLIDDAQESVDRGAKEITEADQKTRYVAAWLAGQVAVSRIAHEAKLEESAWDLYLDPIKDAYLSATAAAGKKVDEVASDIGATVKVAVGLMALYMGAKIVGGLRG